MPFIDFITAHRETNSISNFTIIFVFGTIAFALWTTRSCDYWLLSGISSELQSSCWEWRAAMATVRCSRPEQRCCVIVLTVDTKVRLLTPRFSVSSSQQQSAAVRGQNKSWHPTKTATLTLQHCITALWLQNTLQLSSLVVVNLDFFLSLIVVWMLARGNINVFGIY